MYIYMYIYKYVTQKQCLVKQAYALLQVQILPATVTAQAAFMFCLISVYLDV